MKNKVVQNAGLTRVVDSGIILNMPNAVYQGSDNTFYISYNGRDRRIYGSDTTAIVLSEKGHGEVFLILNGNHLNSLDGLSMAESIQYIIDNYSLINPIGDEGLLFMHKCIENNNAGLSLFSDNEDKFTIMMRKIRYE